MTPKVKKLVDKILKNPDAIKSILNDPTYGRTSVVEDFDTTSYFAEKAIKEIKAMQHTDEPSEDDLTERERATEPINADKWTAPDEWVYDKNYTYNAEDEKYVFMTRQYGNIVRPKSWVKNLVQAYSDWDGDPATITEVCRRFGITRSLFNEIKSILGLTHDHEPFTPDEVKTMSEQEMAMEAHQMKRFRTKVEFDKIDWKATQKEAKKWRNLKQSVLDEINAKLPEINVNPIKIKGSKGGNIPKTVVVETGDWHLGAKAKGLPTVPDYSPEILKDYIDKMIWIVKNEFPESEIVIHFTGDLMETITGLNHKDSWRNIEDGYYGAKPIVEGVELLSYLVSSLKAKRIVAVTGNHGRFTSDNKVDTEGGAEIVVYEMLKKVLKGVEVRYSTFWAKDVVDDIGHIINHGHHRLGKGENIVRLWNQLEDKVDYILYKQGHTHNRNIVEDNNLYRHYVVPAMFTGAKYNERNGYGNIAGFTVSYKHPFTGKVKTEDYSL